VLKRDDWLDLARKLDWEFSYVREEDVYPEVQSGTPWLPHSEWQDWEEPFRTTYTEYVINQHKKDAAVQAVRESVGRIEDFEKQSKPWLNGLKLHAATLPLAEFAAVIGNLRGARFGRDSAWRIMATFGALDEFRHTQIPLQIMHEIVKRDPQFDWTHKFYHTNDWVAVAGRHLMDELLLGSEAVEFAVATHFVFETGCTNLQFIGLASVAHQAGDRMFEKMVSSIQTDEARHAQIGHAVLSKLVQHAPERAQYLLDKWFWRSFMLFAIVTGFTMDYLTPLEQRMMSFKEFMHEWVLDQYIRTLDEFGMQKPWYWDTFLRALDYYHHMVYVSAYTYRATVWFDFVVPSPKERAWLRRKYPSSWLQLEPVWERVIERWRQADPGNDWAVHGTCMVGLCDMCQLVLCHGTPQENSATNLDYSGRKYIFCSAPCRWIFEKEPERYAGHKNIVSRILAGEAPANLIGLLQRYFLLTPQTWGKDSFGGDYPWLSRPAKSAQPPQIVPPEGG
jgi:toluene monooxygenase system protein A